MVDFEITATSSMKDVLEKNRVYRSAVSSEELLKWNYLQYYTDDAHPHPSGVPTAGYDSFQIGLFGIDMTQFFDDCATTKYCDVHNYEYFDGWAIGMIAYHSPLTTKS